jgi:hypothetical protein
MAITVAAIDAIATIPQKDETARELTRQEAIARMSTEVLALRDRGYSWKRSRTSSHAKAVAAEKAHHVAGAEVADAAEDVDVHLVGWTTERVGTGDRTRESRRARLRASTDRPPRAGRRASSPAGGSWWTRFAPRAAR